MKDPDIDRLQCRKCDGYPSRLIGGLCEDCWHKEIVQEDREIPQSSESDEYKYDNTKSYESDYQHNVNLGMGLFGMF